MIFSFSSSTMRCDLFRIIQVRNQKNRSSFQKNRSSKAIEPSKTQVICLSQVVDGDRKHENVHIICQQPGSNDLILATRVVCHPSPNVCLYVKRNLNPDILSMGPQKHQIVLHVMKKNSIEIATSKWASGYLQSAYNAFKEKKITKEQAYSLFWVICQYACWESDQQNEDILRQQSLYIRKVTDLKLAVQCLRQLPVIKYGRKGKPHKTNLVIEGLEKIQWISKIRSKRQGIALASIVQINPGHTTDVMRKAIRKCTVGDEKRCLSLVTPTRTLDLCAENEVQRDWLLNALNRIVHQAKENEKLASKHVELNIKKRLHNMQLLKYGRKGKPHKTNIQIGNNGFVQWKSKPATCSIKQKCNFFLKDITTISTGHSTHVFCRSRGSNAHNCLSLVTKTRTLDLEAPTTATRDWLLSAFQYLLQLDKERNTSITKFKAQAERDFWRKQFYRKENTYFSKKITNSRGISNEITNSHG